MDQLWVRKQAKLGWRWGVSDFYKREEQRPEYKGEIRYDPVSGTAKKMALSKGKCKICTGAMISLFFVLLVIARSLGLMIYKAILTVAGDNTSAQLICFANAIQIKILNFVRNI